MTITQSIKKALDDGVPEVDKRVFAVTPHSIENLDRPFITFQIEEDDVTESDQEAGMDEAGEFLTGVHATVEIRAWSDDYDEAYDVIKKVRGVLHGFQGELGGTGGVKIRHGHSIGRGDEYESLTADTGIYRWMNDFDLLYSEE